MMAERSMLAKLLEQLCMCKYCKEFKAVEFFAGDGEVSKALRDLPNDDEDANDVAKVSAHKFN